MDSKTKKFIDKVLLIDKHKKKGYTYENFKYNGAHGKSWITCPVHGDFEQAANEHIKGKGCSKCANNIRLTLKQFINKIYIKHSKNKELYDYTNTIYINDSTPIEIICNKCKTKFKQTPNNHYTKNQGCRNCKSSSAEKIIYQLFIDNNINFEQQKRFKDCKKIQPLPFDFYLIDFNILIEYDGEQHFKPKSFSRDQTKKNKYNNLKNIKEKDLIKTIWAQKNNIFLIRISYLEKTNLKQKIEKLVSLLKNDNMNLIELKELL